MLETILYVVLGLVGLIAILALIVALMPNDFRVVRSANMAAPAADVFAQVNDFHKWEAWNPWGKIDPTMKQTYEGAPAGVGAVYNWKGNGQVGEGRMTIVDSRPNERIAIKLEFFKPFAATNAAEFTFKPEARGTAVTWSMAGKKIFITKLFSLIMSMDKMLGGQFEKGLADMRAIVERKAA
jgi:uncharacterized protein YndB with AHSA1/START domain